MTTRPVIRCKHTPPGEVIPPAGTVLRQPDGALVLYVGGDPTNPAIAPERVAAVLDGAASVLLVGAVGRSLKARILQLWTEQRCAERQAAKPPAPVKAEKQVCGQPKKDGSPCTLAAGWGTDTPGSGACWHHGGSTALADEQLRLVQQQAQTFAKLRRKSRTSPLTVREQLDSVRALIAVAEYQQRPKRRRRT